MRVLQQGWSLFQFHGAKNYVVVERAVRWRGGTPGHGCPSAAHRSVRRGGTAGAGRTPRCVALASVRHTFNANVPHARYH